MKLANQAIYFRVNKKLVLLFTLLLLSNGNVFCQSKLPKTFIYEGIKTTSVDSILKAGYLRISDTTYEIKKFTYVISVLDVSPIFGINQGSKFSDEFITKLSKYPSRGDLLITDILVQKKHTDEPLRKLEQIINIFFRNIYKH